MKYLKTFEDINQYLPSKSDEEIKQNLKDEFIKMGYGNYNKKLKYTKAVLCKEKRFLL